jgi:hypothetical protein
MNKYPIDILREMLEEYSIEADASLIDGYIAIENIDFEDVNKLFNNGIYQEIFERLGISEKSNKRTKDMLEIWFEWDE